GLLRAAEFYLGQGHVELLRNEADGFGERDVLDLLNKCEDVAGEPTAKAMEELPRRMDGERRGLFVVKGTEALVVLRARFLELDVITDDADDVGLLLEGVFEVGRGHGLWAKNLFWGSRTKKGNGRSVVGGWKSCG